MDRPYTVIPRGNYKEALVSTVSSIPFPKIKSPTLQIWGEEDLFLAEGTDEFVDASLIEGIRGAQSDYRRIS